jgi:hypothetical protein
VIEATKDTEKLRAEWILHKEAMHEGSQSAKDLADSYKTLGIEMGKSLKFEDAKLSVANFVKEYQNRLKEGENSARNFVDANKSNMEGWAESFEDETGRIDPALQSIADKYGIVTQRQKEALDVAKLQLDAWESLTPAARKLAEASEAYLAAGIKSGKAFMDARFDIEEFQKSIEKITTTAIPKLVEQSSTVTVALNSIRVAATEADFATSALFSETEAAPVDELSGYESVAP